MRSGDIQKVMKRSEMEKDMDKSTSIVLKLQQKIYRAYETKNFALAYELQWKLVMNYHAQYLSVWKVKTNSGGKTPGIDGIVWNNEIDMDNAIEDLNESLKTKYIALPVKRIWIPKPGKDEERPLGIPSMKDRAMQALWALALEPIMELKADSKSYGCRKSLSTHHAIEDLRKVLSMKYCPRFVLEGDIKGFFDNINHQWIMNNIPMDKNILSQFIKAGILDKGTFKGSESGVPQGGIISPIIANMVLDGLEDVIDSKTAKIIVVRYMDDFVVTGVSVKQMKFFSDKIEEFLKVRGLSLNKEKTKITEISDGFDFLGVQIKEVKDSDKAYGNKKGALIVQPTSKAVRRIRDKINELCMITLLAPYDFIVQYNSIVRGWYEYYKYYNSSKIFKALAIDFWQQVWRWALRKYPKTGAKEIIKLLYTPGKYGGNVLSAKSNEPKGEKVIKMIDLSGMKVCKWQTKARVNNYVK